jgi:hypothetical protein
MAGLAAMNPALILILRCNQAGGMTLGFTVERAVAWFFLQLAAARVR